MNKIILMGRLTRDPELRYGAGANASAVCRYGLAVNRQFKREGEPDADFFNIVAFGKAGEFASKYFKKGQQVAVVGELRFRTYTNRDGNTVNTHDVVVSDQYFAESKNASANNSASDFAPAGAGYNSAAPAPAQQKPNDGFTVDSQISGNEDDLPL
mgnify:CR=1 FL=1